MINIKFEYYVLNYNHNKHKIESFNIFNNIVVQEYTEKAVRKYIRSPKNFTYKSYDGQVVINGFNALVKEIDRIIQWQEFGRFEYEVSVGYPFEEDCNKLEKWDCYKQTVPNMVMITHEVIRQYKEHLKKDGE